MPSDTGTLIEMFQRAYAEAEATCYNPDMWAKGMEKSLWQEYRGTDCEPFKAYMRYRLNMITISNISARPESVTRKGRIPKIIAALHTIVPTIRIESVVNNDLRIYLEATGWKPCVNELHTYTLERE